MKQVSNKSQVMLIGMLYGVLCSAPVLAEDIEIYSSSIDATDAAAANILFVLDTSGSMGAELTSTYPNYDPTITYLACFDASRVYMGISFGPKTIAGTKFTGPEMYCHPDGVAEGYDISTMDQFNASALKCDTAHFALQNIGLYIDRIAQYRLNVAGTVIKWRSMNHIDENFLDNFVECKADQGVHGENTSDGQPYATDAVGEDGWKAGDSGVVAWTSNGSSETLYSGNYLNYIASEPPVTATRLQVMKTALTSVIEASEGINVGLMRYSRNGSGGLVITPMGPIEDVKTDFLFELSKMWDGGNTPISESYYEAVKYMQGSSVDYGDSSSVEQLVSPGASTTTENVSRLSHSNSRTPAGSSIYKSSISDTCQKNYIVLLTDGAPVGDDASGKISNIGISGGCGLIGTSSCLEEIADHIASHDQGSIAGDQFISTFTIGLDIPSAAELLQGTATVSKNVSGTGEYYAADDALSLVVAFADIVQRVLETDTSFSSPAVSVNAFNRSTHLNDLYFTLFKPGENESWDGNFKKYKLAFKTDPTDAAKIIPFIADKTGAEAIDNDTGFFKHSAISYWTDTTAAAPEGGEVGPDGPVVSEGGAVSVLSTGRNIYTLTGAYTNTDGVFVPSTSALTDAVNAVDDANAGLTDSLLAITGFPEKIAGTPYRTTLLNWAHGMDVFDKNKNHDTTDVFGVMGDPLHAEPALVQYGEIAGEADLVAYVATNNGYLHAIDTDDGKELFSFIPQELLDKLTVSMENAGSAKLYALDGNVVAWINDANGNGTIEVGTDHVYLYIGMRRGGNNIYALDVTDRNMPKLLWVIKGGVGDYAELGETWSTINVEKIKDGATEKTVLVFGGGYDVAQDDAVVRPPLGDSVGRAVFIADATSGKRLWMGSSGGDTDISEMKYSIPARIKPLDISGDGFIDRLYAVDMGGQIFRFDIDNPNGLPLKDSIIGGRVADLAGSTAEEARRFYYPPDVALVDDPNGKYHGMVIASGFRAHPLNEVIQDRIYMLKDKRTGSITDPADYALLTNASLQDVTDNIAGGDGVDDAARDAELGNIAAADGWYIDLDDGSGAWIGEKGLSEALIIEGTAVVTTYVPDFTSSTDSCEPKAGNGKVFFLDILDATPAFPAGVDKRPQRHIDLKRGGIPPSPNVIITSDQAPTLCVGTECQSADFGLGIRKTFWHEVER